MNFALSDSILLRRTRERNAIENAMGGEVMNKGTFDKFQDAIILKYFDSHGEEFSMVGLEF